MSKNVHLKFRLGSPEFVKVSAVATMCGVSVEQLAKKALLYAVHSVLSRDADSPIPGRSGTDQSGNGDQEMGDGGPVFPPPRE